MRSLTHAFSVPVMYAFTRTDDADDVTFVPDNEQVGRLAGEHLVGLGRTRIAHLTAHDDPAATERAEGFTAVLRDAGLAPVTIRTRGTWAEADGAALAAELLEDGRGDGVDVDAIFCGNDHMARGAERVLRAHGVRIPDDVALVGVDNWEGIVVRHGGPHLTTVDTRLAQLGATAARQLISGEPASGRQLQPCVLVIGETTSGPPLPQRR